VVYPHHKIAVPRSTPWYPHNLKIKDQGDGIYTFAYRSTHFDSVYLVRTENKQIASQRLFLRPANSDFILENVLSFKDGSFLMLGKVNYIYNPGWMEGYSKPHLVYIDKNGSYQWMEGEDAFQLHYDNLHSQLRIFYPELDANLNYRILDAKGRVYKEGQSQPVSPIDLPHWRTGIYYLQLWVEQESYIGTKPFLKN
jgi:hypothetical protein